MDKPIFCAFNVRRLCDSSCRAFVTFECEHTEEPIIECKRMREGEYLYTVIQEGLDHIAMALAGPEQCDCPECTEMREKETKSNKDQAVLLYS